MVLLRVSPMKGVVRFGKKGKLAPCYICPYEIISRVGNVAYKLSLPPELASVHPVFHVSMLRKCMVDERCVIPVEELIVNNML